MQPTSWMTSEQASAYLGCESVRAFEKIAAREGIPKHYLSARAPATTASNSTRGSWAVAEMWPGPNYGPRSTFAPVIVKSLSNCPA